MNTFIKTTFLLLTLATLSVPFNVLANNLPDYSEIVEEVLPSVVTITTTLDSSAAAQQSDSGNMPVSNPEESAFIASILNTGLVNSGSGFILSESGFVITNAHVVDNAETITVKLHDGQSAQATIIGIDHASDIALLQITANNLTPVKLADKDQILKVGQAVLGIGSPYSFEYSVTTGIISYLGRNLNSESSQQQASSYIQTDMLINPGNSGGPIINGNGEVIGMSSKIFSTTGSSIGISFGIPANIIDLMVNRFLNTDGSDQDPVGIKTANVTTNMIATLGLQQAIGALVMTVAPSGPADMSGLQVNDVIVTVDGAIVRNNEEFLYQASLLQSNKTVRVTAIRSGQYFATELSLSI
tara:strand:+ start:90685 stop:91755 length:1071 start_codon:yes stop_codon:yes gene_type:complete